MPALSYYTNVHNTALVVLERKGYRLWTENEVYCAEKDGWDFMADDPVQLLGVVAIYEFQKPAEYQEYWWRLREPSLLHDLPTTAPEFTPVKRK